MRSCKETTERLTKASYSPLGPVEWLSVHLHLLMCRLCRGHHRQAKILNQASQQLFNGKQKIMRLSASARQRIQQALMTTKDRS